MLGKNILVLVPHPDDEVVACAASIGRARAHGASISALYMTHGCIARETLWPWQRSRYDAMVARRRAEAEEAANFLRLQPVGWSERPARHLWREMRAAFVEIQNAVRVYKIDQLWVPAYEGGNPDHDALNAIGQKFKTTISVLEFAEYNFLDGKASAQIFPKPNGSETVLQLLDTERQTKAKALALYRSEKMNLNYVGTTRESYRPLADYDYGQPPHAGQLWYTRFQWVPFRHPRVDFTNPADVSNAINDFLKT